jgi:hypothetical protein
MLRNPPPMADKVQKAFVRRGCNRLLVALAGRQQAG